MSGLTPRALTRQETTSERFIEIPAEVRSIYSRWSPTPLRRAVQLEKYLGTTARLYYKYEGVSPTGSHKPNTAVAQAYYCSQAGITRVTTETGAGLSLDLLFLSTPPLDSVDPELHGCPIAGLFIRWFGDIAEGWEVIRPLQEFGQPVADTTTEMTYLELQTLLDELNPYGNQHYWTGEYVPELTDEVIDVLHGIGDSRPSPYCIVQVIPFDGKPTEVDPDATALAHRSESWLIHILGQWLDPADSESNIAWVKSWGAGLRAHGEGETSLNLVTDDEEIDRVERFWSDARRSRLAETKRIYDPENRFRFNHNIAPAATVETGAFV